MIATLAAYWYLSLIVFVLSVAYSFWKLTGGTVIFAERKGDTAADEMLKGALNLGLIIGTVPVAAFLAVVSFIALIASLFG